MRLNKATISIAAETENSSRRTEVQKTKRQVIAGQLNANMQHNRANGDTSTKIGVMTP